MRKRIYELTDEELEKNYNNKSIQEVVKFVDSYSKPCETLLNSYIACVKFKNLLEQEIEVLGND